MTSKLLDKKLKSLEQENQRLLEALKTFGRRSANNAVHQPGGGSGVVSGGGGVGSVFGSGGNSGAPLGISRPFRTVTPLHHKSPDMNQLSVDVNSPQGETTIL